MSDDLIRRSDAIKAIFSKPACHGSDGSWYHSDDIRDAVDSIPSADRPQGEWIRTFDGNEWYWYCSNCKEQWYEEDLWMGGNEFPYFCPNCGAKMKGADDV